MFPILELYGLKMTKLGIFPNNINADLNSWEAASSLFANQVSNNSTIFFVQNLYDYYNLGIWATIEEPILKEKVAEIIKVLFGG